MASSRELIVEPHFGARVFPQSSENIACVIMPFGRDELEKIYRETIKPTIEALGLQCFRGDDIFGVNPIMEDVWSLLCRARIVVAEFTGRNPNVMYEAGIAHTLGKPLVCMTQNIDDVPFDLRHFRHIHYDLSEEGAKRLRDALVLTTEAVLSASGILTPRPSQGEHVEEAYHRLLAAEHRRTRVLLEGIERRLIESYAHFYARIRQSKSFWTSRKANATPAFCPVPAQVVDIDFADDEGKRRRLKKEEVIDFHITKYPISNAEFHVFAKECGHPPLTDWVDGEPPKDLMNRPARVSWVDIQGYCMWMSEQLGTRVHLPSEAMWMAASGYGQDHRLFPWGQNWKDNACNSAELGLHEMSSVALFQKDNVSPHGCVDMLGNVWEWTSDNYDSSSTDEFPWRAVRGGAFYSDLKNVGLLARLVAHPGHFLHVRDIGFRVAYI
jgi:formylglycine-generating enzyme required for sulfatase activity